MRDYNELTAEWAELLEILRCGEPDLEAIKNLIFDTYWYLKSELKSDTIPRDQLELYKYIGQVCQSLYTDYAFGIKHSESMAFHACAMGLCFVYEHGFVGYCENPLQIGLNMHTPAGCSEPEADMTTYETFDKGFKENVEYLREYCDEDYDEEDDDE